MFVIITGDPFHSGIGVVGPYAERTLQAMQDLKEARESCVASFVEASNPKNDTEHNFAVIYGSVVDTLSIALFKDCDDALDFADDTGGNWELVEL